MSFGVVMLVHTALHRAAQVARHWAVAGCPVVIHVDKSVKAEKFESLADSLSDLNHVVFCERHHCEWGTWGIVAASQTASALMLQQFPEVRHVFWHLDLACRCAQ